MARLKSLLRFPNYFPNQTYGDLRFWMGAPGQKSTIHNDNYHNLNAQLYGRKTFLLFAPDQYPFLYTRPMNQTCWASPIDPEQREHENYPLFARAEAFEAQLQAGDLLYIPIFWWHQATAVSLSINVSMFSYLEETQFWTQGTGSLSGCNLGAARESPDLRSELVGRTGAQEGVDKRYD
jgi:lysine-specific demethylase 8